MADQAVARAQATQYGDVFFLVEDKHRQRPDNIKRGYEQYKRQDEEDS